MAERYAPVKDPSILIRPLHQAGEMSIVVKLQRRVWGYSEAFDPLQLKNAHFNLARLGAIVRRYIPHFYGRPSSPLHAGLPTDRLATEWWIRSARVQDLLSGKRLTLGPRGRDPAYNAETMDTAWHVIPDFIASSLVGKNVARASDFPELVTNVYGHEMVKMVLRMRSGMRSRSSKTFLCASSCVARWRKLPAVFRLAFRKIHSLLKSGRKTAHRLSAHQVED
jgi:hypothetical protein